MRRPQATRIISEWLAAVPAKAATKRIDKFDIAIATTQGLARRENQDRACFARLRSPSSAQAPVSIGIVCDGMGGMLAGGECATVAIGVILSEFSALIGHADPRPAFLQAIRAANDELFERYSGAGGTTLSAVLFSAGRQLAVNAGDSRIYSVAKQMVRQLSRDDTVASEARDLDAVSAAILRQLELGDQLTQFLGIGPELELSEIELDHLSQRDRLFLMTDGAWRSSDEIFITLMRNAADSFEGAQRIVNVSDWCGGIDNTTVLALSRIGDLASNTGPVATHEAGVAIEMWSAFGRSSVFIGKSTSAEVVRLEAVTGND